MTFDWEKHEQENRAVAFPEVPANGDLKGVYTLDNQKARIDARRAVEFCERRKRDQCPECGRCREICQHRRG